MNINLMNFKVYFEILKNSCTVRSYMEKTIDSSSDGIASDEQPDTWFYLPGMPSPSVEHNRVGRYLRRLFRRRGVLPADLLFGRSDR